MKTSMNMYQN